MPVSLALQSAENLCPGEALQIRDLLLDGKCWYPVGVPVPVGGDRKDRFVDGLSTNQNEIRMWLMLLFNTKWHGRCSLNLCSDLVAGQKGNKPHSLQLHMCILSYNYNLWGGLKIQHHTLQSQLWSFCGQLGGG